MPSLSLPYDQFFIRSDETGLMSIEVENVRAHLYELKSGEVVFNCEYSRVVPNGLLEYTPETDPDWLHDAVEKHYDEKLVVMASLEHNQPDEP